MLGAKLVKVTAANKTGAQQEEDKPDIKPKLNTENIVIFSPLLSSRATPLSGGSRGILNNWGKLKIGLIVITPIKIKNNPSR